ncbi:uncharacterized protein LOC129896794 [Solanum dulcamara]|uniref:uncharacterized protein LOC129896794 n=1 Tax=Solanum dulcamara TaxID=45834 RepID=UPI002485EB5B|nr:uncharacterized protein LOC129896794 [Solanum dulcamara]
MAFLIKFGLTMELLLLSTGLVSTFFMLKKAITPPYLFNMFFVNLSEILNYMKSFLSSPLYICLFINFVVILILTFSKFQHPIMKFLNVFLDNEKDVEHDDIQIHPQAHHQEKEDYMPNRTNSAIAMETVMSFFNRYNSHPDIQDDMSTTTTLPQSQIRWGRTDSAQTTTTTLPQSQTRRDRLRAKAKSAQTTATTTTLPQSQTSWDWSSAKIDSSPRTSHNFPDISHLTEAREIVSPRSSNPLDRERTTRTNCQENIEEGELEDDSLEATWKAIIKKKELRKSLTFNDTFSTSRIGGLRGDISVSTEESNKKFDDFIKKINQERLLQRQESDQRAHNVNMLNLLTS